MNKAYDLHNSTNNLRQISLTYNYLDGVDINDSYKRYSIKPNKYISSIYLENKDKHFLNLIDSLVKYINNNLNDYISCFLLHGSLATQDYCKGWSDVDTFMVLKQSTIKSPKSLVELRLKCLNLRQKFYQICPLQHHGIMAYTDYDLRNYLSSFLPLEALEDSLDLFAKQKIQFNKIPRDESDKNPGLGRIKYIYKLTQEALVNGSFFHHPYKGVPLMIEYKNSENAMKQLFWFMGTIMTMPAFLLTALNRPTLKKNSFAVTKRIYSKESWGLINDCSKVRELWAEKEGNNYIGNNIPNWLMSNFSKFYMNRFNDLLRESIEIISRNKI